MRNGGREWGRKGGREGVGEEGREGGIGEVLGSEPGVAF